MYISNRDLKYVDIKIKIWFFKGIEILLKSSSLGNSVMPYSSMSDWIKTSKPKILELCENSQQLLILATGRQCQVPLFLYSFTTR